MTVRVSSLNAAPIVYDSEASHEGVAKYRTCTGDDQLSYICKLKDIPEPSGPQREISIEYELGELVQNCEPFLR